MGAVISAPAGSTDLGVELVEQPLPRGEDAQLDGLQPAIAQAADESCTDSSSLTALAGRYQYITIKLDKCGGLTEALALAEAARARGLRLMIGCMEGTSLGIAALARIAADVNRSIENIGARRLYTVMERVFEELSFTAPDRAGEEVTVDAGFVEKNLGALARSADVSRYVL